MWLRAGHRGWPDGRPGPAGPQIPAIRPNGAQRGQAPNRFALFGFSGLNARRVGDAEPRIYSRQFRFLGRNFTGVLQRSADYGAPLRHGPIRARSSRSPSQRGRRPKPACVVRILEVEIAENRRRGATNRCQPALVFARLASQPVSQPARQPTDQAASQPASHLDRQAAGQPGRHELRMRPTRRPN